MKTYQTMSINDLRSLISRLNKALANPRLNATNRDNICAWIGEAWHQIWIAETGSVA